MPLQRPQPRATQPDLLHRPVELRLETTGRKELVRWILSWMPDVKVLAPRSLRDRVAEKLRDGLRAQEWDWIEPPLKDLGRSATEPAT